MSFHDKQCYNEAFELVILTGLFVPRSECSGSVGVVVLLLEFLCVVKCLSRIIRIIMNIIPEGTQRARR